MRTPSVALATFALLASAVASAPAQARSVVVRDATAGEPAAFAIKSVKFTNGVKRVKMRAQTPDLDLDYVEWASLTILTGKKSSRPYARQYTVSWDRDGSVALESHGPSRQGRHARDLLCKGLRLTSTRSEGLWRCLFRPDA